jgi:hypothetical protein
MQTYCLQFFCVTPGLIVYLRLEQSAFLVFEHFIVLRY